MQISENDSGFIAVLASSPRVTKAKAYFSYAAYMLAIVGIAMLLPSWLAKIAAVGLATLVLLTPFMMYFGVKTLAPNSDPKAILGIMARSWPLSPWVQIPLDVICTLPFFTLGVGWGLLVLGPCLIVSSTFLILRRMPESNLT